MDLNYLFHREQISLFNAQAAGNGPARAAHAGLARGYAGVIGAGVIGDRYARYRFRKAPLRQNAL